jgi:putative peptide zinc metalloprotease protein
VAGLALAWWPHPGTYRPIQPYEGGTLVQAASAVSALSPARSAPTQLVEGQRGRIVTGWADGDARPTEDKPQLALVLVPRSSDGTTTGTGSAADGGDQAQPWVFPFNKPLDPGKGDNQAMAVNTQDNTIRYDVAFALVWVEDDSPALNTNEAYAFASCNNCAAVSVGFQIVLVTGDNHVAVPKNISAAVNYDCVNCLTYALATQLFVTLDGPLSAAGTKQISELWQQIAEFGTHITEVPLSEIRDRLTAYEQQILAIIEKEQGPLDPNAPTATPTAGSTDAAQATDGASPTGDASQPGDASSPSAGSTGDGSTGGSSGSSDPSSDATGDTGGSPSTGSSPQADPTPSAVETPAAAASATP